MVLGLVPSAASAGSVNVEVIYNSRLRLMDRLSCYHVEDDFDVPACRERIWADLVRCFHQRLGGLGLHARKADVETGREAISTVRNSQVNLSIDSYLRRKGDLLL